MTNPAPLQSPEYAALVAAKEAHGEAVATMEYYKGKLLNAATGAIETSVYEPRFSYRAAYFETDKTGEAMEAAQAAFDAAYPAPADVTDAVEAAKQAAIIHAMNVDNFDASLTPAQQELQTAIEASKDALDATVTAAKALIEAAQVSPSKAFVIKRSVKAKLENPYDLIDMIDQRDAPIELIKVDETALAKWVKEKGSVELDVELTEAISVAFYAAKL